MNTRYLFLTAALSLSISAMAVVPHDATTDGVAPSIDAYAKIVGHKGYQVPEKFKGNVVFNHNISSRQNYFKATTSSRPTFDVQLKAPAANSLAAVQIYGENFDPEDDAAVYSIPLTGEAPTSFEAISRKSEYFYGSGVVRGENFMLMASAYTYMGYFFGSTLNCVTMNDDGTYRLSDLGISSETLQFFDGVYDHVDCVSYVNYYDYADQNFHWGTAYYNPTTDVFSVESIAVIDDNYTLAIDAAGQIYAIGNPEAMNMNLYKVEKTTGEFTLVGSLGYNNQYLTTATIDKATGILYYATCTSGGSNLITVDTATGKGSLVYELPYSTEFMGMHTPYAPAYPQAPGEPENVSVYSEHNSLSGSISFQAPGVAYDGTTPLSGTLNYTVLIESRKVADGTIEPGATTAVNFTVATASNYKFEVYCTNSEGNGKRASVTQWVGWDKPKKLGTVSFDLNDEVLTLSWPAAESSTSTPLDYSRLTYKVTVNPWGIVEYTDGTEIDINLPANPIERYIFNSTITPVYFDTEYTSLASASDYYSYGEIGLPWTETFDHAGRLVDWRIANNRQYNKSTGWRWSNGGLVNITGANIDGNDYLETPSMYLEKDKVYEVGIHAWSDHLSYMTDPYLSIIAGPAGDEPGDLCPIDNLTYEVMPSTQIVKGSSADMGYYSGRFIAPADGYYCFALYYGTRDTNWTNIYVDDLTVEAGRSQKAPAKVENLQVVPDQYGELRTVITFNAPERNIMGGRLTGLDRVNIERNGELIASLGPNPGAAARYVDEYPLAGVNVYKLTTYGDGTMGESTEASCYVGYAVNDEMYNVDATRQDASTVDVTWDAITNDPNGKPFKEGDVQYEVYSVVNGNQVGDLMGTTTDSHLTFKVCNATATQRFYTFAVRAVTPAGGSSYYGTPALPFGEAYDTPYLENFNGGLHYNMIGLGNWEWVNREECGLLGRCDGEFFGIAASRPGDSFYYQTAFIEVPEDLTNPVASIDWYGIAAQGLANRNEIYLEISEDAKNFSPLNSSLMNGGENPDPAEGNDPQYTCVDSWGTLFASLDNYLGKKVMIRVRVVCQNYQYMFTDNLFVGSRANNDLAFHSITVPEEVVAGEDFTAYLELENKGMKPTQNFSVDLFVDGAKRATLTADAPVEPSCFVTLKSTVSTTPGMTPQLPVTAALTFEADEKAENNTPEDREVNLIFADKPGARNLSAYLEDDDTDVVLTWENAPDSEMPVETATYDWEEFEYMDTDQLGDWTTYDVDGFEIDSGFWWEGAYYAPFGFWVMDYTVDEGYGIPDEGNYGEYYKPFSGDKYLVSLLGINDDGEYVVDDYLVSPELSGSAQTISFRARTTDECGLYYGAHMQVIYSTEGNSLEDFQNSENIALNLDYIPFNDGEWNLFTVDLPEGAKYMAIRHYSFDDSWYLGLQIDDITVGLKDAKPVPYVLKGHELYRDGVLVNEYSLIEGTSYVDQDVTPGDHRYVVVAKYEEGDARPSNIETINVPEPSSVDEPAAEGIVIAVDGLDIVVKGAEGEEISVYTLEGQTVAHTQGSAMVRIRVDQGFYLVSAGDKTAKVIVR